MKGGRQLQQNKDVQLALTQDESRWLENIGDLWPMQVSCGVADGL